MKTHYKTSNGHQRALVGPTMVPEEEVLTCIYVLHNYKTDLRPWYPYPSITIMVFYLCINKVLFC